MRRRPRTLALSLALVATAACTPEAAPGLSPAPPAPAPPAPAPPAPESQAKASVASKAPRAPKPGERVRQPELDGYCEGDSAVAFYYHGGAPTTRVARNDRCTPLFLSECEAEGRCYPPRDQEPGMWCCAPRSDEASPVIHAAK